MTDVAIRIFSRIRATYKNVFLICAGLFLLSYSAAFAERYEIDEQSSLENSVASLLELKNALLEQGYNAPSLTGLCLNVYGYLDARGIDVDPVEFQRLYEEIERQERNDTLQIQLVEYFKSDKKQDVKLSNKTICGFIKCLTGGLLCTIPVPVVQTAGMGLIMTGVNDCIDGARELMDKNQQKQERVESGQLPPS